MGTLIVPSLDEEPWPTFGGEVVDFLRERAVYGPGSLKGEPYEPDPEFVAQIYRAFEVYPRWHRLAGRRRFKRVCVSCRKGLAKTEKQMLLAYCHLHPEGPGVFDGWDASGNPVARPVRDPYVPMLAVTVEQVEELAYGALYFECTEGPDADLFDASLERVIRLDEWGHADGKAVPLSGSPGARDGARTTLNCFDEPHRLFLPRAKAAHETMVANLEKRVLEDPWGLYVGTAGEPGQGSVAEDLHAEAEAIRDGMIEEPFLCYFHRDSGDVNPATGRAWDFTVFEERVAAVREATGPAGEYGPGQFESIAHQWDRPKADFSYLERVWLNRWVRSAAQAFDKGRWDALEGPPIPDGAFVTVGFDGARRRDSTGLVVTDIATGRQRLFGAWEKPIDWDETHDEGDGWEIAEADVTGAVEDVFSRFVVWRMYGDPPWWIETMGAWAARHPDQVVEWWTNRHKPMAWAVRAYRDAVNDGVVSHEVGFNADLEAAFSRHIGNAGRNPVNLFDDDGSQLFLLRKLHPQRPFDHAMAAVLSWQARLDALKAGATPPKRDLTKAGYRPKRLL